jgi:hypothetical protein
MTSDAPYPVRWNIFARELENVLRAHNMRLGQLDDPPILLHQEKVRRLQQSLLSPTHFPTLNPEELEQVASHLKFTEAEMIRLRAAIIATGVERTLMDRINPDVALMAANDVFEICLTTMRTQPALAMAVGVKGDSMSNPDTASEEHALAEALDAIDEATLLWLVANNDTSLEAQLPNAKRAQYAYAHAKTLLDQLSAASPRYLSNDQWKFWYSEAEHGYQRTSVLLQSDEGGPA